MGHFGPKRRDKPLKLGDQNATVSYKPLYQKVGQRIEYFRKKKRMTQEQLAEKAGLHRAYFWDIEQGRNISIRTAYNIARALEIKLSQLLAFNFLRFRYNWVTGRQEYLARTFPKSI